MQRVDLADFLLLAEAVSGIDASALASVPHVVARVESALAAPFAEFGGVEFYDRLTTKAAVLCSRILRNHPLPDGNKRVAYLCMIELIRRNDRDWRPVATERERADMVERLAARTLTEEEFAVWSRGRSRSCSGRLAPRPAQARCQVSRRCGRWAPRSARRRRA